MDKSLNMSPQQGEIAQAPLLTNHQFKGSYGNRIGQGEQGGGKFGKSGDQTDESRGGENRKQRRDAYGNYLHSYNTRALTTSGNTASTGVSHNTAGTAFDTSISRYSPNQAQVINF